FVTRPILTEDTAYGFMKDSVCSFDLKNAEITPPRWKIENTGSFQLKDCSALIKAGSRLYAGAPGKVLAVSLPLPKAGWPDVTWEFPVSGTPATVITADDRLFVVMQEGRLLCFGKDPVDPVLH